MLIRAALVVVLSCEFAYASQLTEVQPAYPGKEWELVPATALSPECHRRLSEVEERFQREATTAVLAIQDGRVLFSYGPTSTVSIVESVRKSVLSMLYGKYVAEEQVDLDRTLSDVGIGDIGGLLPIEQKARIRDLLTARSGVFHPAANSGDDLRFAPPRGSQQPGTYFLYNNWDFNAAGSVFEMLTQRDIYRAFEEDIAGPLKLQDYQLAAQSRIGDGRKSVHMPYHFFLSTRDMARIGYLMLNNGRWEGQQVVPEEWVAKTTRAVTPSSDMHPATTAARRVGYSYLWWTLEEPATSPLAGAYMAWGLHGQYILVIPRSRMVVAHKREVPVGGRWDVPSVGKTAFLAAAQMLATAPCAAGPR